MNSDSPPHTDDALDALYRGPRETFIERRNALATRLQVGGRSADAAVVRTLSKPSVSAWVVNQLWWEHREDYDALHAAGAALADRQREAASVAGQPANDARRAAILVLRKAAETILRDAGHATSTAMMRRITQSLEASAAGGSFGQDDTLGRLHRDLPPPGFGAVRRFAAPESAQATTQAARRNTAELAHERAAAELRDALGVLQAAEAAMADAEAALARARHIVADAKQTRARVQERVDAAIAELEDASTALERLR